MEWEELTVMTVHAQVAPQTGKPLLTIKGIRVQFSGVLALDDVSFDIPRGMIVGLIGPNGAGKTTLFNCISRLYHPSRGEILCEGKNILARPTHRIAELGIGRTFQNVASFDDLTALDNIRVGAHTRGRAGIVSDMLGLPHVRREQRGIDDDIDDIVRLLGIADILDRRISELSLGSRKYVEIARALAGRPKLLLLDEPAGGLTHSEVKALGEMLRRIRDERGVTVLLVEHHMQLVMSVSDRVVVLNFGRNLAEGAPAEIRQNADVIKAYLGGIH